jgi:hypothetical protein
VGIREEKPALTVNIFSLEGWNGKKGKAAYSNRWITNLEAGEKNIAERYTAYIQPDFVPAKRWIYRLYCP